MDNDIDHLFISIWIGKSIENGICMFLEVYYGSLMGVICYQSSGIFSDYLIGMIFICC